MMRLRHTLAALAAFAFAVVLPSQANTVYFPGLWQSRFVQPSPYGFASQTNLAPPLTSNLVAVTAADYLDRTPGVVMGYNAGNGPADKQNPISGRKWGWHNYDVYAYEGEMFVEAGQTYQFYGRFDDGEALVVDGKLVVYQGDESGYNKEPVVATSYTAAKTGWVPFNAWIWDWTGGKNVISCRFGLQYNPTGTASTSYSDANVWKEIVDPGDMSLLRVKGSADYTAISSVTAAENGTDLEVAAAFTDLPLAGTVYACYGALDGGIASTSAWDHVEAVGTVAAGSSTATYTLAGAAGNKALRLYVEGNAGVANYFTEWTEVTTLSVDPLVSFVALQPGSAGVTATVDLRALGVGASEVDLTLEVADSADGFAAPVATVPFAGNPLSALGAVSLVATGLSTDTPYWFRVKAENDLDGVAFSEVLSLTLSPTAPVGTYAFVATVGTTMSATATVTSLGDSAASVKIRLEAYKDAAFQNLAGASAEVTVTEPQSVALSADLPAFSTDYYLRVRFVNDWGLTTYAADAEPRTTDEPPFSPGKVYLAGLMQVKLASAIDKTTSAADALANGTAVAVPGAIMASTSTSADNPYDGQAYWWGGNTTWAYIGQMYFEAGKTYYFGKNIDDSAYVTIDGTVVMDNDAYNQLRVDSYTPATSGWKDVDLRFGNGTGGAGANGGTIGFGYNTDGISSFTADTFKDGGPWSKILDPGDASLLRTVYSETPFFAVEAVAPSGSDLSVTASFAGLPEGAALTAYYGAGNGGYDTGAWASSAVIATPAAGDTASATYTVPGAGSSSFVIFRLDGTETPWFQWSDVFNLSEESPVFGLTVTGVAFTNATFIAACTGLGAGGTSAETILQFSATRDFGTILREEPLTLAGIGSQTLTLNGFTTNTTYYARVFGENDHGAEGSSSPVAFTMLEPQFAEGSCAFAGRGFTSLSVTGLCTTYGEGSATATMVAEASATADFAALAGSSEEISPIVGVGSTLAIPALAPNAAYYLRVRIINEWGLETVLPVAGTFSTRKAPLAASGVGYTFADDGSTVDISFGVTEVYDGASCTATLTYGGKVIGTKTFDAAGSLVWEGVEAAGGAAAAVVTVESTVGGTPYSQTWNVTSTPGTRAYALATLAELSNVAFHVGDTATLPELTGASDYYAPLDIRSFKLGADGLTLTAIEPGFSAVVAMEWDATSSAFIRNDTVGMAVCIPEVEGSGRVFLATTKSGNWSWADATKWANLTDPTAEADYPHLVDDVAIIPLPASTVGINADITLGELYVGCSVDKINTEIRIDSSTGNTLTFSRSSGEPGLLRLTGLSRTDIIASGYTKLNIGAYGAGYKGPSGLTVEMPGGLVLDGGALPDYTDTALQDVHNRSVIEIGIGGNGGQNGNCWNIPEGQTLRCINIYGRKLRGDDQGGNANFRWAESFPLVGKGTFLYDGVSSTQFAMPFAAFEGTFVVRNKQKYDNFAMGSRGGSCWFTGLSDGSYGTNATLLVEGDTAHNSLGSSFGVASYGNSHGYGSWGWVGNALPSKKWILNGGTFRASAMNNTDPSWREDGTTATQPVCVPNGAETLVVSNGFSSISLGENGNADRPTNCVTFAKLEHAGDGTIKIDTDRTYYSYNNSGAGSSFRVRAVVGGFHDHAIGGSGVAQAVHGASPSNRLDANAPIVPWIVCNVQSATDLYFPGADDETDEIVMAGHPASVVLDEVTDPTMNVNVKAQTSLTLTEDRTVNSLRVLNPNGGSATFNLGEGRTLTITSGGLIVGNGSHSQGGIGNESGYNAGTAGTLYFPNKAYIYAPSQNGENGKHAAIWAKIVSPEGAVFSYPGYLDLGGDQTGIDDHIAVNGTRLTFGSSTTGCEIDVPVHLYGASTRFSIGKEGSFCNQELYFHDHGTDGAKFIPAAGTTEKVYKLYIDGVNMPRGTYGATGSGAQYIDDSHFSGTGIARVMKDDLTHPLILIVH